MTQSHAVIQYRQCNVNTLKFIDKFITMNFRGREKKRAELTEDSVHWVVGSKLYFRLMWCNDAE